jgi:hypothetical protein
MALLPRWGAPVASAAAGSANLAAAQDGTATAGRAPLYHTLSAPAAGAAVPGTPPRQQIRVVFSETATEKQIRDVLLRVRGRLIDGPSPLGTYTLEVPAAPSVPGARATVQGAGGAEPILNGTSDSLGCVLAYLHGQAVVRFAEPIAPVGGGATANP